LHHLPNQLVGVDLNFVPAWITGEGHQVINLVIRSVATFSLLEEAPVVFLAGLAQQH
jgi:hypothetical protein